MQSFHYSFDKIPRFMQIETTIICQASCWFCPQKKATRRPLIMEWWVLEKILDETKGLGITYRPFILNEPFADKRMPDIIKRIKQDSTARVELNSNGELITPAITEKIIEAGLDTLRLSIDGITKETFDETRGINFDKVYRHVGNLVQRVKETGSPMKLEVRMIRLPGTEQEQVRFREFWEDRGVPVVFTDLYRYPWEGQTKAVQKPCLKILDETFVYVDGRVTLCCWDSAERAVVGDVKTENLLDIWNGQKMKSYRDLLAAGNREAIKLCSRCDAYENLDFSKIKGKNGSHVIYREDLEAQTI